MDFVGLEEFFQCAGKEAVDGVLLGLNGAIFAYGQTSTGKTHTMVGEPWHSQCPNLWEYGSSQQEQEYISLLILVMWMIDGSLWEYLVIHLCNIGISKWVLQLLMFARPESIILTSWLLFFCLMAFAKNVDQFRVVRASNRARELLSDLLWKPFFVGSLSWQFSFWHILT